MPDNMRINIRAMTPDERGFSYTQPDLIEASGCIGHLRVDMGTTGTQFFSSWDDHHKVSLLDCDYEVASAEEVIIGREEAAENLRNQRRLIQHYLKILTPVQARRYVLYYGLNMTLKQIATQEGKAYNAIWESIKWADKKIFEYNCKLSVKMTGNFGSKMDLSEGDNFPRRNLENRIYSVRGTKPA